MPILADLTAISLPLMPSFRLVRVVLNYLVTEGQYAHLRKQQLPELVMLILKKVDSSYFTTNILFWGGSELGPRCQIRPESL